MTPTNSQYTNCNFGDQRLNNRAEKIGTALSNRYGQEKFTAGTNSILGNGINSQMGGIFGT